MANYSYFRMFMYLIIDIHAVILICVAAALFTCVCVKTQADSIFTLLLHSNLYGKQPADYAVSPEMREIFQHASDGTATPLSPSANLSVVCNAHWCVNCVVFGNF